MGRVRVGEEHFNIVVDGDPAAPPLLVSNSLGTNLTLWDGQMPALTRHFRVIRYDSRGHGQSDAPRGPYSIWRLGRDALNILDALGIEKAHFLGLSMGGMVGLWLLANAPDRIGRAVLANTAASMPPPDHWNMRIRMARENGMAAIAPMVANLWFPTGFRERNPEAVARIQTMLAGTTAHGYAACCAALRDMDQRETIRSIRKPVLVIGGRYDQSTPPDRSRAVADAIPDARFLLLDTGHLSNIEAPEAFTAAAVEFLNVKEKAERKPKAKAEKPAAPPPPVPAAPPPEAKPKSSRKAALKKKPAKATKSRSAAKKPAKASKAKTRAAKKAARKAAPRKATKKKAGKKKR
jgi:3-oxoadipate enol-lactonase